MILVLLLEVKFEKVYEPIKLGDTLITYVWIDLLLWGVGCNIKSFAQDAW